MPLSLPPPSAFAALLKARFDALPGGHWQKLALPGAEAPPPADPTPEPSPPAPPGAGAGDMVIVAHQDDDLLFMNPTIAHAVEGDGPVTVVYLTAGDFGQEKPYWSAREAGVKDAYAWMAGDEAPLWREETVSLTHAGQRFDLASSHLESQPEIRFYFLRLPDGFQGQGSDTYGGDSLARLAEGEIARATTVDGLNSYSAADLAAVLRGLMQLHRPEVLHLQSESEIEHSDHIHGAAFAERALEGYDGDLLVRSYAGYDTWGHEENLSAEEEALTTGAFARYAAHDPEVMAPQGGWLEPYVEWVKREHVAEEYLHRGSAPETTPETPPTEAEKPGDATSEPEEAPMAPPSDTPPEQPDPGSGGEAPAEPQPNPGADPGAEAPAEPQPNPGTAHGPEAPSAPQPAPEPHPNPGAEAPGGDPLPLSQTELIAALMAAPGAWWQEEASASPESLTDDLMAEG